MQLAEMMHNLGSLRSSSDGFITQQQAMNSDAQHSSPSGKRLTLDAARKLAEGNITPTQLLDFLAKMDWWAFVNDCMTGTRSPNTHAQQQSSGMIQAVCLAIAGGSSIPCSVAACISAAR